MLADDDNNVQTDVAHLHLCRKCEATSLYLLYRVLDAAG
jgi:hypothetical protein